MLLDEDPQSALAHAQFVRGKASRFALAREALALVAYQLGDWQLALAEFRAARRISGNDEFLPLIVDCERALGRVEKARELIDEHLASTSDSAIRAELLLVAAGMERDSGELKAARQLLDVPELRSNASGGWLARLRYSYADLSLELGEQAEALEWFAAAAEADVDGETDATERLMELQGVSWEDVDLSELEGGELDPSVVAAAEQGGGSKGQP